MEKRYVMTLALAAVACLILGGITGYFVAKYKPIPCEITEMTFYYSEECHWCEKVKDDGTISKLKELGITVVETEVRTREDFIRYDLQGVPTFKIAGELYPGYRTFEQLKELLKCE